MCAACVTSAERGARAGNLAILATYALAVVYDLLEQPGLLRLVTPFRYFLNAEVIGGTVSLPYIALCLALSVAFLVVAFRRFERRDLGAL